MPKPDFNVFELLDITHEKYFSRVLAWLLDPTGNHKQRGFFLKWFLKRCGIPQHTKYESVKLEELIRSTEGDLRRITDIALRCEGYLIYVEVKVDNRSIDKLQLYEQYILGQRQSESENRQFAHVFLTPDETAYELVEETKTKHISWDEVRDILRERVHMLEGRAKQRQKTSSTQVVVLHFLRQFIHRVEERVIGEFVELDPYAFERRLLGIGGYVNEAEARKNIGNFLSAVDREVRDKLPRSLRDTPSVLGTRSYAGCYLYYYFDDYHRLNIQLFFDLVADTAQVGLWLNSVRHRPKLLPDLEAKRTELVDIKIKWPKKGTWTAIGPNIWNISNSNRMLDQAVEQLTLYLQVFGPVIKAYVRRNQLGAAGKRRSRQVELQDESVVVEEIPYSPDEK